MDKIQAFVMEHKMAVAAVAVVAVALVAFCIYKMAGGAKCTRSSECKDGMVCRDERCGDCTSNAQCEGGTRCVDKRCKMPPKCTKDADCADGETCNTATGACEGSGIGPQLSNLFAKLQHMMHGR